MAQPGGGGQVAQLRFIGERLEELVSIAEQTLHLLERLVPLTAGSTEPVPEPEPAPPPQPEPEPAPEAEAPPEPHGSGTPSG